MTGLGDSVDVVGTTAARCLSIRARTVAVRHLDLVEIGCRNVARCY